VGLIHNTEKKREKKNNVFGRIVLKLQWNFHFHHIVLYFSFFLADLHFYGWEMKSTLRKTFPAHPIGQKLDE